ASASLSSIHSRIGSQQMPARRARFSLQTNAHDSAPLHRLPPHCTHLAPWPIAIFPLLGLALPALAANKNWIAVSGITKSGNWNVPGNWSPSGIPANADDAIISVATTLDSIITYDYPGPAITLSSLRLDDTAGGFGSGNAILSMSANNLGSNAEY